MSARKNIDESRTLTTINYSRKRVDPSGKVLVDFGNATGSGVHQRYERKLVRSGGKFTPGTRPQKPYLNHFLKFSYPSGRMRTKDGSNFFDTEGDYGSYSQGGLTTSLDYPHPRGGLYAPEIVGTAAPSLNPDLLSQAEVKALNKLRDKGGDSDIDFGLWFGERKETAQLVTRACKGLVDLAQAIARKDWGRSARAVKDAFGVSSSPSKERARQRRVERWLKWELKRAPSIAERTMRSLEDVALTYNLGISPLMGDIEATITRMRASLTTAAWLLVRARHFREKGGTDVYSPSPDTSVTTVGYELHGYTVTLRAEPTVSTLSMLASWGLANPANTAYQLTRASWLFDYFVSMGPWLEASNVPLQYRFLDGSWTRRIVRNVTKTIETPGGRKAKGWLTLNHTQRFTYSSFPVTIPPLSLHGKDLSVKQAVNASLVLKQYLTALRKGIFLTPKF